jgi:hypothetical protein
VQKDAFGWRNFGEITHAKRLSMLLGCGSGEKEFIGSDALKDHS